MPHGVYFKLDLFGLRLLIIVASVVRMKDFSRSGYCKIGGEIKQYLRVITAVSQF